MGCRDGSVVARGEALNPRSASLGLATGGKTEGGENFNLFSDL